MKSKPKRARKGGETSPARQLEQELAVLRRELRVTSRNYAQRLERELEAAMEMLSRYAPAEKLTREQLHRLRDCMNLVQPRRLRPEKGRRKDLRKIESLISDLRPLLEERK